MKFTNYYKILNIETKSSAEDIKKAYRKLALQYHPDRNKGKTASENFKKITEAYNILKDPQLRKSFDIALTAQVGKEAPILSDTPEKSRGKKGLNLKYYLKIPLNELTNGVTKKISYVRSTQKGDVEQTLSVDIPAMAFSGQRLKVSYMGDEGLDGGPDGDLIIIVELQDEGFILRDGFNAIATIPITIIEAIEGAEIQFYWQNEIIKLNTPKSLPLYFTKVFKAKGLVNPENKKVGDLIVKVVVDVPQHASEEQIAIIKEIFNRLPASSLRKSFLDTNKRRDSTK